MTARSAVDILGIQPNSSILFYHKTRKVIDYHLSFETDEIFDGKIELDESYLGGHRKGKIGQGATGKVAVFGILKRQGKFFTVVVENTKRERLLPVIKRKLSLIAGFIPILIAVMMALMRMHFTTRELIILRYLPSD